MPRLHNSHLKVLYIKVKTQQCLTENPNNPTRLATSKHSEMVGRKMSLLTGRNLQKNQAQGGVAIDCDWLEDKGKRDGTKPKLRETEGKTAMACCSGA